MGGQRACRGREHMQPSSRSMTESAHVPVEGTPTQGPRGPRSVPSDRSDGLERVRASSRGLVEAINRADPALDGFYASDSVLGLIAEEYEGRAVAELLQNAHDQLEPGGRIRILLDDDDQGQPVLYVANDGHPFGDENFDAILRIAASSKEPGTSIGYKGVGFKAVLLLSSSPEVYSSVVGETGAFNGYRFRFGRREDIVEFAGSESADRFVERLPASAFAVPLPEDASPVVGELAGLGYATVVRLPIDQTGAAEKIVAELDDLVGGAAPPHLFLTQVSELLVEHRGAKPTTVRLTRSPCSSPKLPAGFPGTAVDLGPHGRFLIARREVDGPGLLSAIAASIDRNEIDSRWSKVQPPVSVEVAISLDEAEPPGRLYTFLPMGEEEQSPLAGHLNAPFATRLARDRVRFDIPLNAFLVRELAATAVAAARSLRRGGDKALRNQIVDLVAWQGRHSGHVHDLLAHGDRDLVPSIDKGGLCWDRLDAFALWTDVPLRRLSARELVRHTGARIADPLLGHERLERLRIAAEDMWDHDPDPTGDVLAGWAERYAVSLKERRARPAVWLDYYDDIATLFAGTPAVLEGRRILLTEGNELAGCGRRGKITASRNGPVVFFPPTLGEERADDDDDEVGVEDRVPASLARRIAFMHPDLVWTVFNRQTRAREMRPAREFFAAKQLVAPYQAEDILRLVRDVLATSKDRRLAADALRFTFAQARGRGLPAEPRLDSLGLRVPGKTGRWIPASRASFGSEWRGTSGTLLERVLDAWTDDDLMARVRSTIIAAPESWPRHRLPRPTEHWRDFLVQIGVRDGLWPYDGKREPLTGSGWDFHDQETMVHRAGLPAVVTDDWAAVTVKRAPSPYYTTVAYGVEGQIPVLPGHATHADQPYESRLLYGRLLAASIGRWPARVFEVEIRRPRNAPTRDSVKWPSPVRAFLERRPWIPVAQPRVQPGTGSRAEELSPTDEAWHYEDDAREQPPSFVPLIAADLRRRIAADDILRERLTTLGMPTWGDGASAPGALVHMARSFARFGVLEGLELRFGQAYRQMWSEVARATEPLDGALLPSEVVVSSAGRLEVANLETASEIWVLTTPDRLTETVLRTVERPVLVANAGDGDVIRDRLADRWGSRIVTVGAGDTQVIVDGSALEALPSRDRFVDTIAPWLPELVALTLSLRASQFSRVSHGAVHQVLERLRRVRIHECETFDLRLRGIDVPRPAAFRFAVPADDETAPTIVMRPGAAATWDGLRSVVPALVELVRQATAGPPLRDVLVDLGRVMGVEELTRPTVEEYAEAFGEDLDRIEAILADHRGSLDELLFALRPLIALFSDLDTARAFNPPPDGAEQVTAALRSIAAIGARADELTEAASTTTDLAELRDRFRISVRAFNEALRGLGPPYRALRYEDEAWHALEHWIAAHRAATFDALRAAHRVAFVTRGSLETYARAASAIDTISTPGRRVREAVDGLGPDPEWAEAFNVVPEPEVEGRVLAWLSDRGATFGTRFDEPDRDGVREANAERLRAEVTSLAVTVSAWATRHGGLVRPEWATTQGAGEIIDRLLAEGWCDFRPLDAQWLIDWLVSRDLWPASMARTIVLDELGLTTADLDAERSEADRQRAQANRRRRTVVLDDEAVSLEEDTSELVRRVLAGLAENPKTLTSKLRLTKLQPIARSDGRGGGGGGDREPGGRGRGKGWDRQLTDDQKTLIGAIGEIAAYEWLDHQIGLSPQCWRSTNRATRFAGDPGDDGLGYDIAVADRRGTRFFEVKATTGDGTDGSIELSPGEARFARSQLRGRYNVLLVTNVLDSSQRGFHLLPNPFAPDAVDLFRVRNRGFRFSFRL